VEHAVVTLSDQHSLLQTTDKQPLHTPPTLRHLHSFHFTTHSAEGSRIPEYRDDQNMKVVMLSVLRTGRLYPKINSPGTHFC